MNISAGYLGAGNNLHNKIIGDGQFVSTSQKVLVDAKNVLMKVVSACDEIASRYKSAEDLNAMDAEAFAREVSDAKGAINSLTL